MKKQILCICFVYTIAAISCIANATTVEIRDSLSTKKSDTVIVLTFNDGRIDKLQIPKDRLDMEEVVKWAKERILEKKRNY